MAIRWYCDLCGVEIVKPEHPVKLCSYLEPANRDLGGFGEVEYLMEAHCHRACATRYVDENNMRAKISFKNNTS